MGHHWTRRAMSGEDAVVEFPGMHQQLFFATSGVPVYRGIRMHCYAVVKGTGCGLQTKHVLEQMDVKEKLTIHSDLSAARGFVRRLESAKA
eukprot:4900462-Amphidinium_carterae.2